MCAQVCQQVTIKLAVFELDTLGCFAQDILTLWLLISVRVLGALSFELNLTTAASFDLSWRHDELLHDCIHR